MTREATETPAFRALQDALKALHSRETIRVRAGHADLGPGLWLSCDPESRAEMACLPQGDGFRLTLVEGDSGLWNCLGMQLPAEILADGRYAGLLIEAVPEAMAAFTPILRYRLRRGGHQDAAFPQPVLLPAGPRSEMVHLPLDAELLERSESCELNLFFHMDRMDLKITGLEPLLLS